MKMDWMDAEWANGPKLAEWIRARMPSEIVSKDINVLARRVRYWELGEQAAFDTVDTYLTRLGHHVSELPNDVWEESNPKRKCRHIYSPGERQEFVKVVQGGVTPSQMAERIGVSAHTIRQWVRNAAKGGNGGTALVSP